MEYCDQYLDECVWVILQWSSHHFIFIELVFFNLIIFYVLLLCINKVIIFMGILHMVNMAVWVKNWTDFTFGQVQAIIAWISPVFWDESLSLLKSFGRDKYLGFLWRICSLGDFALMYNGTLKGKFSSVPPFWICSYLTLFLLRTHTRQVYFRYGIDDVLDLWKDLCWYGWLVFMCWCCWPVFMW